MAYEYDPWSGEYKETESAPVVTADPLTAVEAPTPAPVPGVTGGTATQAAPGEPSTEIPKSGVAKAVTEVAEALSYPVRHPMGFLEGVSDQVKGVFVDPFVQAAQNPEDIGKQFDPRELTRDTPGFSMVPGYATAFDVQTPEGREHLKEHPSQLVLDAMGLFGGGNKPGGRMAAVTEKASQATGAATDLLSRTAPGREVVTALGTSEKLAPLRDMFPTSRTPETAAFPTSQRAAAKKATARAAPVMDEAAKLKPTEAELAQLKVDLDAGRGSSNPRLASLYDRINEWSSADRIAKVERAVPEEVVPLVREATQAKLMPKLAKGIAGELKAQGMPAVEAAQQGQTMASRMLDAFRRDEPNPFPERPKAWKLIERGHEYAVKQAGKRDRLYEHQTPVGPELFDFDQHRNLAHAERLYQKRVEAGIDPALAQADLQKAYARNVPGRFQNTETMRGLVRLKEEMQARVATQEGFGPGAARAALEESLGGVEKTWMDLANEGMNPVYVPSRALKSPIDELGQARAKLDTTRPGSLRANNGKASYYEDNPLVMIPHAESELFSQHMTQKAIAQTYQKTGGTTYDRALQTYLDKGFSEVQAHKLVQSRYRGLSNKLDGATKKAAPGDLVIRADVAKSMDHYFTTQMPSMVERAFGAWMVPVLWLAPMFHVNNILGGAVMTSLNRGSPLPLLAYAREAFHMAKNGGAGLDPRVPHGAIGAPIYGRKAASFERGQKMAQALSTLRKPADWSRQFGEFMDSFYRSVVELDEFARSSAKGYDAIAAQDRAVAAASNVLQNWDSFSPIERAVVQKVMPFVGWRKTVLRTLGTMPMDHPFLTHFLYGLSQDAEELEGLPEEWKNLVGISEDVDGKRYYVSTRGQDPFADASDMFSLRGLLSNLHPFIGNTLEAFGVDTYVGGAPAFTQDIDVDAYTGRLKQQPKGFAALWDIVPQADALFRAVGLHDIPPPKNETPNGWLKWLDTYGTLLRATPGISNRDIEEARDQLKRNLASARKAQERMAEREQEPVKAEPAKPAATPAQASGGTTYDPWTGTYK